MRILALTLIVILLLSSVVFPLVYAEEEQRLFTLKVICVYERTNIPVPNVLVEVYSGKKAAAMGFTGGDGSVSFLLKEGNYTVTVKFYSYSESRNITLNKDITLRFAVKPPSVRPKPVVFTYPFELTIPKEGGLLLSFPRSKGINSSVTFTRPNANYTLEISGVNVNFKARTIGPYTLIINVAYPSVDWYAFRIQVYTVEGYLSLDTTQLVYGSNVTIICKLKVISIPHYPTAEEIARAQQLLFVKFANMIINSTIKDNILTRMQLKKMEQDVNSVKEQLTSSLRLVSDSLKSFKEDVAFFTSNMWFTIGILGALIFILGVGFLMFFRSYSELKPITGIVPSRTVKTKIPSELKVLDERIGRLEKSIEELKDKIVASQRQVQVKVEEVKPSKPKLFKPEFKLKFGLKVKGKTADYLVLFVLFTLLYILWLEFYYLLQLPIPKPPIP